MAEKPTRPALSSFRDSVEWTEEEIGDMIKEEEESYQDRVDVFRSTKGCDSRWIESMVACKLDNFFKSLGRSFEEAKHRGNWNEKNIVFLIKAADKLAAKQVSEALKWVISLMVNGEPRSADILNVVNFCVRLVVALQENHVKVASAAVGSHTANNDVGVHEVIELHLLPWLAKTICIARDNGVRLQGVRLIRLICHSLSEMAALEVGLFDLLTEVMLDRARDRNSKVRCEAMDALRFFQNVQDRGCPVVKAITFHCQKDPNWQVRRAALSSLQMGTRSLLVIIARTADINPNVRATSYKIIGANVPYDKVNAVNRQIILKRGLSDIEQRVRSGFSKRVLKKWIAEDKGILNFLRENDVTSCPEIMRDALKAYFEDLLPEAIIEPVKEVLHDAKSVIKIDHLTPELCFYWKGAYEYLKAKIESEFPDFDPETRPKPFVEAPETEDEDKENRNEAEHGNRMRLFEALKQIQPLEVHFLDYVFDFKKRLNNVEAVRDNEASRALVEKIERHFMFNCLLEMLQFFPFTDVAARDKLCGMLKELLVDVDLPNTFLPAACAMMTKIFETEEAQNELLLEIVSDIRKPLRPDPVPVVIQTESRPLKSDPTMDLKFQAALLLQKQLRDLRRNPVEGFSAGLIDDSDIYHWEVVIFGPANTPYDGGLFKAHLIFSKEYPNRPPKMKFVSDMWHPNIRRNGEVCISILHEPGDDSWGYEAASERWLPVHTVESILLSVISMLADPNTESPANVEAAKQLRDNPEDFRKRVLESVRKSQQFDD
ncbi:unnamed protein product [Notodromas monacha]|uniref:E2 ubiquitin-conjugating enzyme n=1 Tax=Notodromas monacha TaxID=399045 RepID=A0A7R9GI24_9CRUS|nr:unnamed protein product [Notodromas monacha]CAG0921364.1 unnamed protein product [Notodromas monacha]